ncbi:aminotransferase class I/II-fold pyridoxal phosphate-dependent enzyme [Pedobacter sp. HMF7647]|uniref:Aminotransferase class I/II-fold pyridoxal phosphate-dependent enzyme n=1 Tax=Hufsiella arboris TaxID=2695275 RepID=A0A7K1Y8U4_9SPHI|nr:methionine aminotransferase [Hufsiella arboris]MXV50489.1 aminotransferase class I/II-fold pyridoxal phosphate-dependent enzyme [Hufsiella arboris]
MLYLHSKLPATGTTIFTVMSQLAAETGAINLSQGFPDYDCDPELTELVVSSFKAGHNQYAPMAGVMKLRERIAEKNELLYQAQYNPDSEITVTAGGTQALFSAIGSTIRPDDEVIVFEPAYDSYAPAVRLFGGVVKTFKLDPPYKIDWDNVKKAINSHTRMIILNSPNNPTGSILKQKDIDQLIRITKGTDILILSDEVYEHLIYDGEKHLSMALFPELAERSFICASFGKLLHTTGWKIGYCLAPAALMTEFRKVHQYEVFSVNTPLQHAIADYLKDEEVYLRLLGFFQEKRDFFRKLMNETKFDLLPCSGSYFQMASYKNVSNEPDFDLAMRLTRDFGVASIPESAFYSSKTDHGLLRFCFAKKQETLEKAVERLLKF